MIDARISAQNDGHRLVCATVSTNVAVKGYFQQNSDNSLRFMWLVNQVEMLVIERCSFSET
jgi:hypothetical protein